MTANDVVTALAALGSATELTKVRKRLQPGEEAFGVRMGHLFEVAKSYRQLPLPEVNRLLDQRAYEPRMAAMCILDFKARNRLDEAERFQLCRTYLDRHDRITTWDMVDRAAPRVVGGYMVGRSPESFYELAAASQPLQRRTAITAPLFFVRAGSDDDLAAGFNIAARLAADPEPVVHNAVGIFLKHAGTRDPERLSAFLTEHAREMPRPGLRLAISKLSRKDRSHFLGL